MVLTRVQQNANEKGRRILHKGCKQQVKSSMSSLLYINLGIQWYSVVVWRLINRTAQTFSTGRHAYCLIQQSRFSRMAPYHLHSCPLRVKFWYSCCCSWQEIAANIWSGSISQVLLCSNGNRIICPGIMRQVESWSWGCIIICGISDHSRRLRRRPARK